jgi:hypothetical protein
VTRALAAGIVAIAALVLPTGCGGTATPHGDATSPVAASQPPASAPAPVRIAHLPPSAKDIIDAVIASGSVPLSVSPTCANVGTEPSDATVGRYLAGFLAELSSPSKKNWIETKTVAGRSSSGDEVSICSLTLRHEDGDDRWGWGVQFQVRTRDRVVLTDSFSCLGAG